MRDSPFVQGEYSGVNKLCQQCNKECKQFANVKVIRCSFVSNQKEGGTLPLATTGVCRGKEASYMAVGGKQ